MTLINLSDTQVPTDSAVEAKAKSIIEAGTTYDYIFDVWQRRHAIDSLVGRSLLLSVGPQSMTNSKGFHVQICGDGGAGKSDAAAQMCKLIDPTYMLDAAVTPQALFYPAENFNDSSIVFIDDMVWADDLGVSVKRITSKFQDGAQRLVTVERAALRQSSKKRLTFWVSCVDNHADEQIRDRFLLVESESSPKQLDTKIQAIKAHDAGKTTAFPADLAFETSVCHALIKDLKKQSFEVLIPFAEQISIHNGIRAYVMFADMIRSFAVFSYATHKADEFCRLIATEEDFEKAKALYEQLGGHSQSKYTGAELNFLVELQAHGGTATKAEMQKYLGKCLGWIGDILNGRGKNGQQKHGLLYKCPYLTIDNSVRPYIIKLDPGWRTEACNVTLSTLHV